jgi:hypothetical protein
VAWHWMRLLVHLQFWYCSDTILFSRLLVYLDYRMNLCYICFDNAYNTSFCWKINLLLVLELLLIFSQLLLNYERSVIHSFFFIFNFAYICKHATYMINLFYMMTYILCLWNLIQWSTTWNDRNSLLMPVWFSFHLFFNVLS